MTNTNHGLVKTAPARELAFFGAHINLHYLFVLYAGVSIYIYNPDIHYLHHDLLLLLPCLVMLLSVALYWVDYCRKYDLILTYRYLHN